MPTQSTNSTPANGPGLAYTADGQTWIIAPGVLVASNDSDGVKSTFVGSELHNFGTVVSGDNDDGVSFTDGGLVENGSTGFIVGNEFGIVVSGGVADQSSAVINAGMVQGGLYAIGISTSGGALFGNSGTASGLLAGAYVTATEDIRVVNSGTIEGNYVGLVAFGVSPGQTITIINSGTIKAGDLVPGVESGGIFANGDSILLQNSGVIVGKVVADGNGESVTRVENSGLIDGETTLGDGNDTFDGTWGTQGAVHGENGDDLIIGGAGDDALYGELGNDTLTGGGGADWFWFTTEPDSKTNRDTITDFSQSDGDKIVLDRDIFTGLGETATKLKGKYFEVANKPHSKNDIIVYNEKKGILIYAENGSKTDKADWIKFANVQKGADLDHGDFLIV